MSEAPAPRPHRRRPALIVIAALCGVVVAAWVGQTIATSGAGETKGSPAPAYSIKVERGGEVLKQYDLAALHALPQTQVTIDGKEQDGPLLVTVLHDAGLGDFASVTIRGAGVRDDGRLTLSGEEAGSGVLLDFSERGTVKACGPRLEWSDWVRDVLTIDVS